MEQIRTNTHGPFRSERSGAEREEEIKILKRKRFSISLHAQTERNGMGNGMDEQTHTDRSALNGAERSGTGAVRARAFVLFSKSPTQPYKNNYNL